MAANQKTLQKDFELWLKASYFYYHAADPIITDDEWDKLAEKLALNWDKFYSPHKHLVELSEDGKPVLLCGDYISLHNYPTLVFSP